MTTLNSYKGTKIKIKMEVVAAPFQVLDIEEEVKVPTATQSANINTNKMDVSNDEEMTMNNLNPHPSSTKLSNYQFIRDRTKKTISSS